MPGLEWNVLDEYMKGCIYAIIFMTNLGLISEAMVKRDKHKPCFIFSSLYNIPVLMLDCQLTSPSILSIDTSFGRLIGAVSYSYLKPKISEEPLLFRI